MAGRPDGIMGVYSTNRDSPTMASYHTILRGVLASDSCNNISEDSNMQLLLQGLLLNCSSRRNCVLHQCVLLVTADGVINAIAEVARSPDAKCTNASSSGTSTVESAGQSFLTYADFASCVFKAASNLQQHHDL